MGRRISRAGASAQGFAARRPGFNPGGAPKETLELLVSPQIDRRLFVAKNVCHGVRWTGDLQAALKRRLQVAASTRVWAW